MTMWKKIIALTISGTLVLGMCACKSREPEDNEIEIEVVEEPIEVEAPEENTEILSDLEATISWWTYPIFVQEVYPCRRQLRLLPLETAHLPSSTS